MSKILNYVWKKTQFFLNTIWFKIAYVKSLLDLINWYWIYQYKQIENMVCILCIIASIDINYISSGNYWISINILFIGQIEIVEKLIPIINENDLLWSPLQPNHCYSNFVIQIHNFATQHSCPIFYGNFIFRQTMFGHYAFA